MGLTAAHINVMLGLVGDPPIAGRGLWALARGIASGALAAGESWTYERRLVIGAHADVAATTDVLFPMLGVTQGDSALVGRVQPAGLRVGVLIEREGAGPMTHAMARTSGPDVGRYRARVPPGRYRVTLRAPQRVPRVLEVSVPPNGEVRVPDQVFAPLGALRFAPAFADGGPGRVIVRGTRGTPDPVFGDELLDYRLDGSRPPSGRETDTLYFAGLASDPERVELAPGHYLLTAVRGLHHDAVTRAMRVVTGTEITSSAPSPAAPWSRWQRRLRSAGPRSQRCPLRTQSRVKGPLPNWSRIGSKTGMAMLRRCQLAPSTTSVSPVMNAA